MNGACRAGSCAYGWVSEWSECEDWGSTVHQGRHYHTGHLDYTQLVKNNFLFSVVR